MYNLFYLIMTAVAKDASSSIIMLIITSVFGLFGATGFITTIYKSRRARADKLADAELEDKKKDNEKVSELLVEISTMMDERTQDKVKIAELEQLIKLLNRQINIMVAQELAENPQDKMKAWLNGRDK
jgi:peptidoglycan hydrolase CwlO-like protein